MTQMAQSRRRFLATLSAAGGAGLIGATGATGQEAPPETTTVRLSKITGTCIAPQYLAEEFLRLEGFTDVRYVMSEAGIGQSRSLARGEIDFSLNFAAPLVIPIDDGDPISILAGVHSGCFELFGNERIRSVADLKGKAVGVQGLGASPHVFLAAIAANVGLDPLKDINWITTPSVTPKELFAEGKIDAFLGFPPEPQELRARNIGRVIVNSAIDRPWSQYFCCMIIGHREFIRQHPVATKRAMRAILKTADLCALAPERAAQSLVDKGLAKQYEYALQLMQDLPYGKWRDYNPEDTVRFYALRLHEAGMIKSSPQKLIAEGTDWRFFNELKKELKG
jgi:NitT/TauT family transport system substrate-binding protein